MLWLAIVPILLAGASVFYLYYAGYITKGSTYIKSRRNYLFKKESSDNNEALIEKDLSDILTQLPKNYAIIHKYSRNIVADYVVIGPTGIYVIEEKDARGQVIVSDDELTLNILNNISNIVTEISKQYRMLASEFRTVNRGNTIVKPILCFTSATVKYNNKGTYKGINIVSKTDILGHITGREALLDDPEIRNIIKYLLHRATYNYYRSTAS